MAVAIMTKFLGPTNSRGSRIKATTTDYNPSTDRPDTLTMNWDHRLNSQDNHTAAAQALAQKMEWDGEWVGGGTGDGMVFVRRVSHSTFTI